MMQEFMQFDAEKDRNEPYRRGSLRLEDEWIKCRCAV